MCEKKTNGLVRARLAMAQPNKFETVYRGIQGAREIRPLYITVALSLPQKRHVIYLVWLRETTSLPTYSYYVVKE
jgi:hypothetical protein